jgi:hypothetical protein
MKLDLIRKALLVVGIAVFAAGVMPSAASSASGAGDQNATVVYPPGAHPYGRSYAEWTGAWWQWAASLPTTNHPLFDTGGSDVTWYSSQFLIALSKRTLIE